MSTTTATMTAQGDPHTPTPLETLTPRLNTTSTTTNQPSNSINNTTPTPTPNQPPKTTKHPLPKLLSTAFSFFVAGVNDGSIGALIPYILRSYNITTALVTTLYACTLAGWLVAALTSTHLAQRLRLGYLLTLGAALQAVAFAVRCWPGRGPPFGVYVVSFFVASLGQGYQDAFGNSFVAGLGLDEKAREAARGAGGGRRREEGLKKVQRWLGVIHAMYMAGCLVAPFAAASIAATGTVGGGGGEGGEERWWLFYTVPLGLGVVNVGLVLVAFRDVLGFVGRSKSGRRMVGADEAEVKKSASKLIKNALSQRSVWLLCLFFFFYLGVVVTAGGWVVEYLVDVRDGDIAQMGYVPAGYSGGALLGRILLPEPTHRLGERKMVFLYCVLCLGFQLVFWL